MTILINNTFFSSSSPIEGRTKRFLGTGSVPTLLGHGGGAQEDRVATGLVSEGGAPVAGRYIMAVERQSGRITAWTISAADGTYSIPVDKARESLLICLDNTGGVVQNDLINRVFPQT